MKNFEVIIVWEGGFTTSSIVQSKTNEESKQVILSKMNSKSQILTLISTEVI